MNGKNRMSGEEVHLKRMKEKQEKQGSIISVHLRKIADKIDEKYEKEHISLDSQNMEYKNLDEYIIEKTDGSSHDISVRGERLSHDKITIQARWIVRGEQRKGIFQTPDKKFWKIRGRDGDAWDAETMWFEQLHPDSVADTIVQAEQSA